MATIPNPYNYVSPIGQALGNLTKTMLSGPNQAERIKAAEEALKLKNTRESTGRVADMFGAYDQPGFDRNALARDAVIAGYDPANMERYLAYNTPGTNVEARDRAFGGAGGSYSGTETAFGIDQGNQNMRAANTLAETVRNNDIQSVDRRYNVDQVVGQSRYEFDNKPQPSLVNGVPAFVPQSGVFDPTVAPIMSETDQKGTQLGKAWGNLGDLPVPEQRVLGADASAGERKPFTIVAGGKSYVTQDGLVDVYGNPIPGGPGSYVAGVQGGANDTGVTTAVRTDLQGDKIAADTFDSILGATRQAVIDAPDTMFGVTGNIQNLTQGISAIATNVSAGLGFKAPAQALQTFQDQMRRDGVDQSIISGIFDPRLGEMQTLYGTLVYAYARVLSGGGVLSNQDVQAAVDAVGNPLGLLASKQGLLSKLDALAKISSAKESVTDKYLNPGAAAAAEGTVVDWRTYFGAK